MLEAAALYCVVGRLMDAPTMEGLPIKNGSDYWKTINWTIDLDFSSNASCHNLELVLIGLTQIHNLPCVDYDVPLPYVQAIIFAPTRIE